MDRLWTPWRYAYITGASQDPAPGVPPGLAAFLEAPGTPRPHPQCVFCNMIAAVDFSIAQGMSPLNASREALIVHRGEHAFLCLNRFPYTSGHLLVVPYEHSDSLAKLPAETAQEIMSHAQRVDAVLRSIYRPDGLNFGLNLGEAAGAGVASHLHLHALPRWSGDSNFMTATAETRILPEALPETWRKLRQAFGEPIDV